MYTKHIATVMSPRPPHYVGDGFRVHNFIPGILGNRYRMDPFIMLDYNSSFYFPPTDTPRGVDVHPHRGFETVTIAYKGKVAHQDSAGNSGIIEEGDVQWMTAASGILHKEYHEKNFSKTGGDFQIVQLWINLPAKDKMSSPKYQAITRKDIRSFTLAEKSGTVEVIAGKYEGVTGAATTFSPVELYNARLQQGAKASFSFPADYNTALLVIEGSVRINDKEIVPQDHFALFDKTGETLLAEATEKAIVLILSGAPLNEPIAAQGPFVMNTQTELIQAIDDYNRGKFGFLD